MVSITNAPRLSLFDPRKSTSLLREVSASQHFRIIEAPKLVAEWVAQAGIFTSIASNVANGFGKILGAESLVFLMGDLKEGPGTFKALKDRVVELIHSKKADGHKGSFTKKVVELAHAVRRSVALVAGTISDWFDSCKFAESLAVLKAKTVKAIAPTALVANGCGVFSAGSNLFDSVTGLVKTSVPHTKDESLKSTMTDVAKDKDRWESLKWGSCLALHSVAVATILAGVNVAAVVTLAMTTSLFVSRIGSTYRDVQLGMLKRQTPENLKAAKLA